MCIKELQWDRKSTEVLSIILYENQLSIKTLPIPCDLAPSLTSFD